jgi:hypothetical protein
MGLTIHYDLKTTFGPKQIVKARQIVEQLRQKALDLPFEEVRDIVEISDPKECDFEYWREKDEDKMWLLIQSQGQIKVQHPDGPSYHSYLSIKPIHIIAFTAWPGEGCEPANFGLCLYPASIKVENKYVPTKLGARWSWHSFCKTQYASQISTEHFLRCHLSVIRMLDYAKTIPSLHTKVHDEGHYWDKRDIQALAQEIGEWNEMIAAMGGMLKDSLGQENVVAPITKFADFEQMEARGRKKLSEKMADGILKVAKEKLKRT